MTDPAGRPTAAGMYDYYLGGSAHSPADRAAAEQIVQALPAVRDTAWANRGFLQRAVRWLAAEAGIRQFLDIGSGLPTERNTHDVATEINPQARVVYVDSDPAAVARGADLLAGQDRVAAIHGDVRDLTAILADPQTRRLIDLSEPVGLLLVTVLTYVPDSDDPWALAARYVDALPSGSYVALSHGAEAEGVGDAAQELGARVYAMTDNPPTGRSRTEVERFLPGLEIVPPYEGAGPVITYVGMWGAEDPELADSEGSRLVYAAVARKP